MRTLLPAIILAGGRDSAAFVNAGENPRRGLADIHGRPMIRYVVDALRAAPDVGLIAVVCGEGFPEIPGVDLNVAACGDMVANLSAGLRSCRDAGDGALLTSSDAPFLTSEAVTDFVKRCAETGAPLDYAVIPRAANEARFPMMRRTYVRLADGEFTGGNLFYLRQDAWPAVEPVLARAYRNRKKPWLLAHLLGPRILWRLARRTLTISEVEAKISGLLGCGCRAIITPYAEIGADVDDPADLAAARQLLPPADEYNVLAP